MSNYNRLGNIHNRFQTDAKKIILNLPDKYEWNDPELIQLIKKQYSDVAIMEKAHV